MLDILNVFKKLLVCGKSSGQIERGFAMKTLRYGVIAIVLLTARRKKTTS